MALCARMEEGNRLKTFSFKGRFAKVKFPGTLMFTKDLS